jgi:hypothetical protein
MDLKHWNIVLSHLSDVSDWMPFFIFCLLPVEKRKEYKTLGAYLLLMSLFKTLTFLMISIKGHVNTYWLYHIMALVEVICLYFYLMPSLPLKRSLMYGVISAVVLFNLANSLYIQNINEFNSNAWSINTILLIAVALYYLFNFFSKLDLLEFEKSPTFMITTGLLIYFSGSLFLYIVSSKVLSQQAQGFFYNAWLIHSCSDIIKSILLTFGLWLAKRKSMIL